MVDHFLSPYFSTSSRTSWSSSSVQAPLTRPGLSTFCHLCRHWTSDFELPNAVAAICFQFLPPYCSTAERRRLSSSTVHRPRNSGSIDVEEEELLLLLPGPPVLPPGDIAAAEEEEEEEEDEGEEAEVAVLRDRAREGEGRGEVDAEVNVVGGRIVSDAAPAAIAAAAAAAAEVGGDEVRPRPAAVPVCGDDDDEEEDEGAVDPGRRMEEGELDG